MEGASLPVWAQGVGMLAVAIVASIIGVLKYLKTEAKNPITTEPSSGAILSATFTDSKLLKDLTEALREHQEETGRDAKKLIRAHQDLREAILENTEAQVVTADSSTNLMRFIRMHVLRDNNHEKDV